MKILLTVCTGSQGAQPFTTVTIIENEVEVGDFSAAKEVIENFVGKPMWLGDTYGFCFAGRIAKER